MFGSIVSVALSLGLLLVDVIHYLLPSLTARECSDFPPLANARGKLYLNKSNKLIKFTLSVAKSDHPIC